jgi:arylsulfatase A-like enzyme
VCSPTRASLLTGNSPARVGVTDWIDFEGNLHPKRGKLVDAEYTDHLPHDQTTIATTLAASGYRTWHVGKWHLGGAQQDSLPTDHGFDVNVGGSEWGAPLFASNGYFSPEEHPNLECPDRAGEYLPDVLADRVVELIDGHATAQSSGGQTDPDADPFFLQYCPYLVHTPLQAPEDAIDRYRRKRRSLGLEDVEEFEIGERFPSEHKRDDRIRRRLVQSDPTYAAMVEAMDRNVGRVLETLERTGQAENTIVIVTSDNGGLSTTEGSPTTNRPLAEGKGWMLEGGNRVPMLVRWPGVTDTESAPDLIETPVITSDIHPTICEAVGVDPPAGQAIDGASLRPLLADPEGTLDREAIFWHYPHYGNQGGTPAAAIRTAEWKLIEYFETGEAELYHLAEDIRETTDLSDHRPNKTDALRKRLHDWQADAGATFPAENPDFEPWPDRAGPAQRL